MEDKATLTKDCENLREQLAETMSIVNRQQSFEGRLKDSEIKCAKLVADIDKLNTNKNNDCPGHKLLQSQIKLEEEIEKLNKMVCSSISND